MGIAEVFKSFGNSVERNSFTFRFIEPEANMNTDNTTLSED